MFKKVAITGHSSGIGKSFYEYFSKTSIVKGFDLVNGYDIEADAEKIINESIDCDLFINNACVDETFAQANLAKLWHQSHKGDKFFIIQLSSIVVRTNITLNVPLEIYTRGKRALEDVHSTINVSNDSCKSIIVSPGIVDTDRVERFEPITLRVYNKLKENNSLLTADDVVNITTKNLELINERYFPSLIEIFNQKIILAG